MFFSCCLHEFSGEDLGWDTEQPMSYTLPAPMACTYKQNIRWLLRMEKSFVLWNEKTLNNKQTKAWRLNQQTLILRYSVQHNRDTLHATKSSTGFFSLFATFGEWEGIQDGGKDLTQLNRNLPFCMQAILCYWVSEFSCISQWEEGMYKSQQSISPSSVT